MSGLLNLPCPGFVLSHEGRAVHVEVSPCSSMYAPYGLQVRLALEPKAANAEAIFLNEPTISCRDARGPLDAAALRELAEATAQRWLAKNGIAPIQRAADEWAKASAKYEAEAKVEAAREKAHLERTIAIRKKHGFTHRIVAWIHPKRGGDDYRIEAWTKGEPSPAEIALLLRDSRVKDDLIVHAL